MAKITRAQKEKVVADLKENFDKASAYLLADYQGLSVTQLQELKRSLREAGTEFTVAKNTLINLATSGSDKEIPEEHLTGPTALLFSFGDAIESIKKLADFIKQYQLPKIKIAFLEGKPLSKEQVITLSKLPGRQELYAQVIGSLNSPLYGLVSVLNGNLQNLVYVLKQIGESRSKGGAS